jgi:hypothetical protein
VGALFCDEVFYATLLKKVKRKVRDMKKDVGKTE